MAIEKAISTTSAPRRAWTSRNLGPGAAGSLSKIKVPASLRTA
jgi:hypothetical protein